MPLDSSCLVISPFGFVAFASTAVPSDGLASAWLVDGRLAAAPSGVPGVVADEDGAGAAAGAGAEVAGEDGGEEAGVDDEPGAGAPAAGVAGAEEAGAGGGASGASLRLQPASIRAPSSDAAARELRSGARSGEAGCRMVVVVRIAFMAGLEG